MTQTPLQTDDLKDQVSDVLKDTPFSPQNDSLVTDQLRSEILSSFKKRTLFKGFTEVLNAIIAHKDLKIYLSGPLDKVFDQKLKNIISQIENHKNEVILLDKSDRRLVYDCIKNEVKPTKNKITQPKRYFNTRIFAIVK